MFSIFLDWRSHVVGACPVHVRVGTGCWKLIYCLVSETFISGALIFSDSFVWLRWSFHKILVTLGCHLLIIVGLGSSHYLHLVLPHRLQDDQ